MFTPAGMDQVIGEVEVGARQAGRALAAVELVAWQAMRLSTTLAARDEGRYRRWAALLMRSTQADVLETLGISPDVIAAVRAAFDAGGEETAGARVPDEVVRRLVLTGDPDALVEQVQRVRVRGFDGVSIVGLGNTEVVQDTLRRFALDVVARSDR